MRKRMWSAAAALMVAVPGAGAAWASTGPGTSPAATAPRPAQAAAPTVTMVDPNPSNPQESKFEPAEITVAPGTAVTFRNDGQQPHNVKADDGSFTSPMLNNGDTWQHTFASPGVFSYKCEPHPWMTGTVKVQ